MPTAPDNHDAHDYAERIRERLLESVFGSHPFTDCRVEPNSDKI